MRRITALGVVGAILLAGCGWLEEDSDDTLAPLLPPPAIVEEGPNTAEEPAARGGLDDGSAIDIDRDDEPCTEDELRLDPSDDTDFVVAHRVVNGQLGPVCFGQGDWTLLEAWNVLSSIAASDQLRLLSRFAGYASPDDDDGDTTVAYVFTADDEGRAFQMAINLDVGGEDADELALTIAHEFSHVLSRSHTQMDRFSDPVRCTTYDSGEGCFEEGSYIALWVEEFWADWLDELDPAQEATTALGEPRCAADDRFLNDYAASDPEEDFAESFSAFVFDVPVLASVGPRLQFFERFPELSAVRDRARLADLGPLPNTFTGCG